MEEIYVDVLKGTVQTITATEKDNLTNNYKIIIIRDDKRVDLTNKTLRMVCINESNKFATVLNLDVINAVQGETKLQITNKITIREGVLNCQIAIIGANDYVEATGNLNIYVKNNLFTEFTKALDDKWDLGFIDEILQNANKFNTNFPTWKETFKNAKDLKNNFDNMKESYDKAVANITNGNESATNSEIVQARGNFTNLNNRLNNFNKQINGLKDFVTYEDFGAVGDGQTDDYASIKKAHDYANEHNVRVVSNSTKTYYVKDIPDNIQIKTPVDWGTTKFIIDDTTLDPTTALTWLFEIAPSTEAIDVSDSIKSFDTTTKYIDSIAKYGHCLLYVENSNKKIYKRKGANVDNGYSMQENVEAINGRIVSDINWDYAEVTKALVYPIDNQILTIKGGIFTTITNTMPNVYGDGVNRGIICRRSNTIIENLKHFLTESNTTTSKPYNGWLYIKDCFNVILKDITLTAHKTFYEEKNNQSVAMGNYDICLSSAIKITLDNMVQSNNILDTTTWGIIVSNYVKDIYLNNCHMNRYDCHRELTNIIIDKSTFGIIQFGGFGLAKIRNTKVVGWNFVYLREDYGSSWNGTIDIENCKLITNKKGTNDYTIVYGKNDATWDFGFKCYYPNIKVKDFQIENSNSESVFALIYNKTTGALPIASDVRDDYETETKQGKYPYITKEFAEFDNITTLSPMQLCLFYDNPQYLYRNTKNAVIDLSTGTNVPTSNINITTNYRVTVKNIDFLNSNYVNIKGSIQASSYNPQAITYNNYRMIPTVEFYNCKLKTANTQLPVIFRFYNCYIDNLTFQFTYKQPIIYAENTVFNKTLITHKNVVFNRCIFNAPNSISNVADLKQCHSWVGVFGETSINNTPCFRASVKMENCSFNFDTNLVVPNEMYNKYNIPSNFICKNINFEVFEKK